MDQSQKNILSVIAMIISFFAGATFSDLLTHPHPLTFQTDPNPITFYSQKYNLNTITEEELQELPGIGPLTAKKILLYRKQNLLFQSITDLKKVPTIGTKKYNKLKTFFYIEKSGQ